MNQSEDLHPYVYKALASLKRGHLSRREFVRVATLLGASFATASALSGCNTTAEVTPVPSVPPDSGIERGGTLHIGAPIFTNRISHLGQFISFNLTRIFLEHLTWIDENNITHPFLLEKWQPDEELVTWTLYLNQGIKWNNGEEFNADDVIQSLNRIISNQGTEINLISLNEIERIDDYTLKLYLDEPRLDLPETLFYNNVVITHREEVDNIQFGKNVKTTGPFILEEFEEEKKVRFVRREDYWRVGEDQKPLPYLGSVEIIHLGWEDETYVDALRTGDIDAYVPTRDGFAALREDPNLNILSVPTAATHVLRFRVDLEPWDDYRVRLAVKKLQNREKILTRAMLGEGVLGHDTHVSPVQPDFAQMTVPDFNSEEARALLEEAGIEDLAFSITVVDSWPEAVAYAEALREDAKIAGVDITLDKVSDEDYWDAWTEIPVGITNWGHRSLAVSLLPLAYTADSDGNPVPWNETRWVDEEFSALLAQAQVTLDLEERLAIMAELQRIQSERGSIGIAYWRNTWLIINPAFKNVKAHPSGIIQVAEVWYDPDSDPFT